LARPKLGSLGFEVTLCRLPVPGPGGTGPIQAAWHIPPPQPWPARWPGSAAARPA